MVKLLLNNQKPPRTKQRLILSRETVRSLLSPAFTANDPQKTPKDGLTKHKHCQEKVPTTDPDPALNLCQYQSCTCMDTNNCTDSCQSACGGNG